MKKASALVRALAVAGVVAALTGISACGDGGTSGQAQTSGSTPITRTPGSTAITGTPVTTATAGVPYRFQPQVNTANGAVTFSIANQPAWAEFDPKSGLLSGTPGADEVGRQFAGITISASDGITRATLPPFTITVIDQASADAVTLYWQAPTENADGTPLLDLKGYTLHYGPASRAYSQTVRIANPGLTTYVVQNLAPGDYYFAITAYNSSGRDSAFSGEVSTTVD
ncbi:MAG TPA: putative Ig domain-containing protein [Steroidobacteraceae bacterium]|nr:putative Ig domain-containing protein [Steroidobacteraceae bacterium]